MPNKKFNYYDFSWGKGEIDLSRKTLQTLRLERSFEEIADIDGKILEVGCGEGRAIRTLRKVLKNATTYGCDFSPQSIFNAPKYKDGTYYALCDAHDLPYKDQTFDAIVVYDLIEHVIDVEKVLLEIERVLKTNGIFHCFVPCEINPFTLYWFLWKTGIAPDVKKFVGHIQKFDEDGIMEKLKIAKFVPVKTSYSYHLFGQLMDIVLFTFIKRKSFFDLYYKLNEGKLDGNSGEKLSLLAKLADLLMLKAKNSIHWLAYYESKVLGNNKRAIGFHITNRKKSQR